MKATAAYFTLGCKLNFSETSTISKVFESRGITRCERGSVPSFVVVNTCSVTETADKKGRGMIRHLHRLYPHAAIIVTGCYAQLKSREIAALEGVVMVLGNNEKGKIGEYLDRWLTERQPAVCVSPYAELRDFSPSCERGDRTRYFLKVQDGCDYFCTYCTIPIARGRSRSPRIADLVAQAEKVAREGGKEIVLSGVNIGDFGKGTDETFLDLIRALDQVEGIARYRISSIEPNLLTPEIIRFVAGSRAFMPHFHIPLQAGSDEVLRLMNRRYDTTLFQERISLVREAMPHAFIGVDIIAGAKGETPELWEKSVAFVKSLPITRLHVFPYSERPGTRALEIAYTVSQEEKHRRVKVLNEISQEKLEAFLKEHAGEERPVLWEQPKEGEPMHGFTDNYIRMEAPYDPARVNTITLPSEVKRQKN